MALSHTERFGERERGNGTARRVYTIFGTAGEDETEVFTYLLNTAADSISGLVIQDASCQEIANNGDDVYYTGEVRYGLQQLPTLQATNEVRVSSRASLQTVNVKYSPSTASSHAASWFKGDGSTAGNAADFKGVVGVQPDGKISGFDLMVPTNVLSVSNVLPLSTITPAYQYAAEQLVGKTNSVPYRSRAAGTLLCSGVVFQQQDTENMSISLEFLFSPNVTGLQVGEITGIDKKGWEYIWAYTVDRKIGGRVVPTIAQVNVETPFSGADFDSVLGF